jgi:ribonuclease J
MRDALTVVALGGLGEIGMNCLVLEQRGELIVVDCGVSFPAMDIGIDVLHPRFDHLLAARDRIRGVVLTHGHEDHIGALPYLLADLDVPVVGPPHAIELVRGRLAEHGFSRDEVDLRANPAGREFTLGSFAIEPIRVTHSIADATALAIRTDAGLVLHTGDFKLDPSPPDGELTDEARLAELGREGVRLLLSDSTGIDAPGRSASERSVGEALEATLARARGRAVVGMFASNVQRLRLLGDIAQRLGRRLCLLGRSVQNHVRVAQSLGRLSWPSDLVVAPNVAASMPRERVLIVASGTQAERNAALTRLAHGTHPTLRLDPADVVILSSRIIPGNDRAVFAMMGSLLRRGVELVTRFADPSIHTSGHAHRDEQLRMIELTEPEAFLPVHGTLHHLVRHAELGRNAGIGDVMVVENGEIVAVNPNAALERRGRTTVGEVATYAFEPLEEEVLRDRVELARSGVALVSIVVDASGRIQSEPRVVARGVAAAARVEVRRKASAAVARVLRDAPSGATDDELASLVRTAARRSFEQETAIKPCVEVAITRL